MLRHIRPHVRSGLYGCGLYAKDRRKERKDPQVVLRRWKWRVELMTEEGRSEKRAPHGSVRSLLELIRLCYWAVCRLCQGAKGKQICSQAPSVIYNVITKTIFPATLTVETHIHVVLFFLKQLIKGNKYHFSNIVNKFDSFSKTSPRNSLQTGFAKCGRWLEGALSVMFKADISSQFTWVSLPVAQQLKASNWCQRTVCK